MATTVLCSTIGFSAPSCLFHVRIAPFPPGWRRTSYAVRSAPQRHRTWLHGSARPFPPGWQRPSYAARSASQRHRVSFTFGSPHSLQDGDERLMQCDRPLSAIVPGFTVRLAHSLQDGDDRPMQHDRLLSAIVSLSRSDCPIPSRMATNVLCSAIGPSAPSYLASRFGSPIPSRMATTVLCSTIGFSAPSCLFHVRIAPFPPGWRRTSYAVRSAPQRHRTWLHGSARPFPSGWRRPSYAARSASQRHRVSFTFGSPHSLQDGDERLMQCDRPLSAIVPGFTVRLAHSL
ncbi:unnamed protein product [Cuscuta epithymum]|nr:unnamed protein product [Cuscuta epithymum]